MVRNSILALIAGAGFLAGVPVALASTQDEPVATPADASQTVLVNGALDGGPDDVAFDAVTVSVNGEQAAIEADGRFTARLGHAPYYRVEITGGAIFAAIQTFGPAELRDEACQCLSIPAIELVARKKGRVELFFGGDSMAGRRFFKQSDERAPLLNSATINRDLDALLAPIKPYLETSDIASINLESVLAASEPGEASAKRYVFYSAPELAGALKRAGVDYVTLGNNHTADYGDEGMLSTIAALDAAGLAWSGGGMDEEQALRAARFDVRGEKFGLYGFVGWQGDWTPNQVAAEGKSGAAWGKFGNVRTVTRRERRAGYTPIMQQHGSPEYSDRPSGVSVRRARLTIDEGAPLVVAHHPRVTQGLEIYEGGLIAHSIGNFLFDQDRPQTMSSYALKVWLEDGEFLRAEVIPLHILDYRPVPATGTMREAALRRVAWLSSELGTVLQQSGGHLAVWADQNDAEKTACATSASFNLARFAPLCAGPGAQYGRNILPKGDFENAQFDEAQERFWLGRNAALYFARKPSGAGYLQLVPENPRNGAYFYSRSYLRDIQARHFTFKARIRLARAATVELLIKDRPRQGEAATPSVRGPVVASARFEAGWQHVEFDFALPPESPATPDKARAFRPILRIAFDDTSETGDRAIALDDIALIEWPEGAVGSDPHRAWLWTPCRPKSSAE